MLGVSRPTLIRLLDTGALAHRRTQGTRGHRRIRRKDALAYLRADLERRRHALDELSADAGAFGLFDKRPRRRQGSAVHAYSSMPTSSSRSASATSSSPASTNGLLQRPIVSDTILDEAHRNVVADRPDLDAALIERRFANVRLATDGYGCGFRNVRRRCDHQREGPSRHRRRPVPPG